MTIYYTCPWCNKEDDEELHYIPFEHYCNYCGKPFKVDIAKMEEEDNADV
jgi:hypothetical protein